MSEEDPVVRELDVYVNRDLELLLMQFPLRPSYIDDTGDFLDVKDAQLKPNLGILELHADYGDGGGSTVKMGGVPVAETVSLGVGKLRNNTLHITPIQRVTQVRPSISGPTSGGGNGNGGIDFGGSNMNQSGGGDSDVEGYAQVTVKKKEANPQATVRQHTYLHMKKQEEKEAFKALKTHSIGSEESEQHYEHMYYQDTN
jgi:hypothetical protein